MTKILSFIILFFSMIFPFTAYCLEINSNYLNSITHNLEPRVEEVCLRYLKSKGLPALSMKKANYQLFTYNEIYAFAILDLGTIFLSERMMHSIEKNLNENLEISIFDKFVLLHESGHLNPLGLEYKRFIDTLYKKMVISGAIVSIVSFFALLDCKKINLFNSLTLATVVSSILAAPLLCELIITVIMNKKLKKYSFSHADREYEKFIKNYCEEKDADDFALSLLSQDELEGLRNYFLKMTDMQVIDASEDDYHQSNQELLASIDFEMDKRTL